jgi:hypothetical protein
MGAVGSVVDKKGYWYIANSHASTVGVYRKGRLAFTLQDPGQVPVDVAVSPGLVIVANRSATDGGPGSVTLYANGSKAPTGIIRWRKYVLGVAVALDDQNNCYFGYHDATEGYIVKYTGCSGKPTGLVSNFGSGMDFNRNDRALYFSTQGGSLCKCKFLPSGSRCRFFHEVVNPLGIHFDSGWKHLWVVDSLNRTIDAVDPGSGHVLSYNSTEGFYQAYGVAPDPGPE